MVTQGGDWSFSRPGSACLYDSGLRFAIRYTSIGQSTKNMSPGEVRALTAAGLAVVTVFEETAGHMLGGWNAGVAAAKASVALASSCGMPEGRPHYYALDVDPNPLTGEQWVAVRAYLDGAASVHGKDATGVYAGYRGIEELVPRWAPWGWQTYAWSGGRWSAKAVLQQYRNGVTRCGGQIDLDQALAADYGQWGLEEDMPLTEKEWERLEGLVEDGARRSAHAVMTGLNNNWFDPERSQANYSWYPGATSLVDLKAAIPSPTVLATAFAQALQQQGVVIPVEIDHEKLKTDMAAVLAGMSWKVTAAPPES